uniref:Uncharacterized protein n=1 Tax=Lepeophtheirus salmonis TaxID=72036 RepID=A0A0K2T095_LEPSM
MYQYEPKVFETVVLSLSSYQNLWNSTSVDANFSLFNLRGLQCTGVSVITIL